MTFRAKPLEVEAMCYAKPEDCTAIHTWMGKAHDPGRPRPSNVPEEGFMCGGGAPIAIDTREGVMEAQLGDWIIKEPFPTGDRDFYPVKNAIFRERYTAPIDDGVDGHIDATHRTTASDLLATWRHAPGSVILGTPPSTGDAKAQDIAQALANEARKRDKLWALALIAEAPVAVMHRIVTEMLRLRDGGVSPVGMDVDPSGESAYLRLRRERVATTVVDVPGVNVDLTKDGEIIGVEFLTWPVRNGADA